MRFTRSHRPASEGPRITPRRLSAARQSIARRNEQVALFPDLQDHTTPEERIALQHEDFIDHFQGMRNLRARQWREARRQLALVPAGLKEAILNDWSKAYLPGDPSYLLGLIRTHCRRMAGVAEGFLFL